MAKGYVTRDPDVRKINPSSLPHDPATVPSSATVTPLHPGGCFITPLPYLAAPYGKALQSPALGAQCAILYEAFDELRSLIDTAMAAVQNVHLSEPHDARRWREALRGLSQMHEWMGGHLEEAGVELDTLEALFRKAAGNS